VRAKSEVGRSALDERKCHVSRIWIRGSSMGVRVFAVGVLVTGIGVGVTAGYLNKTGDTLTLKEVSAQNPVAEQEALPPDTDKAQPLPAGARTKQVEAQLVAEAKAKALAQAKADAARRAAKALADRAATLRASRSKKREAAGPSGEAPPLTPVECTSLSGNRRIGCSLLPWAGFKNNQFTCLDKLFTRESHWTTHAANPSGAYGIPQALPGSKMKVYGADWKTNPVVQIKWGLHYIASRYGSPCAAWGHSESVGWY
jgi:hypothetical protein